MRIIWLVPHLAPLSLQPKGLSIHLHAYQWASRRIWCLTYSLKKDIWHQKAAIITPYSVQTSFSLFQCALNTLWSRVLIGLSPESLGLSGKLVPTKCLRLRKLSEREPDSQIYIFMLLYFTISLLKSIWKPEMGRGNPSSTIGAFICTFYVCVYIYIFKHAKN